MNDSSSRADAERIRAYLDEEMTADERRSFEAELAERPALAAELGRYQRMLAVLQGLPRAAPEKPIADAVECTIRRRSRGRYFPLEPPMRLPYETLAVVLLLAVLLTSLFALAPPAETPRFRGRGVPAGAPAGTTAEEIQALGAFGEVTVGEGAVRVVVPAERVDDFPPALPAIGPFRIREVLAHPAGATKTTVFVLERAGPTVRD